MVTTPSMGFGAAGLQAALVSPAAIPAISVISAGAIERIGAEEAKARAPRLIDLGSSYSVAPKQIDVRLVGGLSNPFATHNIPIGDAAYKGEEVTMPAANSATYMADPDAMNVQPMFDPAIGVERIIDPKIEGHSEGMWAIDPSLFYIWGLAVVVGLSPFLIYTMLTELPKAMKKKACRRAMVGDDGFVYIEKAFKAGFSPRFIIDEKIRPMEHVVEAFVQTLVDEEMENLGGGDKYADPIKAWENVAHGLSTLRTVQELKGGYDGKEPCKALKFAVSYTSKIAAELRSTHR